MAELESYTGLQPVVRQSDLNRFLDRVKKEEGFKPHAYQDTQGYWTIGYGCLIDERLGGGISEEEAEYLARNRIRSLVDELTANFPFWPRLDSQRREAFFDMAYQLGVPRLKGFQKMLKALDLEDYETAAAEALDSKWAEQTPNRAKRVADMIRGAR